MTNQDHSQIPDFSQLPEFDLPNLEFLNLEKKNVHNSPKTQTKQPETSPIKEEEKQFTPEPLIQNNHKTTTPFSIKRKKKEKTPGGFIMFFLNNSRISFLLLLAIILSGVYGLMSIDIEANPEINQPIILIQTVYPNSSAKDVEDQITDPLEEVISSLSGLKELSSTSNNNLSTIVADFESQEDSDEVFTDVQNIVNQNANLLPNEAETPKVIQMDFNNVPIVALSLTSSKNKIELTKLANDISDQIKGIDGVSKIELSGDIEENIKIIIDPIKLDYYQLNLAQVTQAISQSNINTPLGSIDKSDNELSLRLVGKFQNLNELKNIPLKNLGQNGSLNQITLAQIATVEQSPKKIKTDSFVSDNKSPAQNAITLNVYKSNGGNIVNIVNSIDQEVININETLSKDSSAKTKIIKTTDNAIFIKNDIKSLSKSGIQTVIIIFFSLLFFLTYKEAAVTAIAIPLIFLMTFTILYFSGYTMNGLTMFALILSLGLIVDTSIVIVEGIHEHRLEGHNPKNSARLALAKYKWPLIAGSATTISAFLPMLLVSGIVGDFIKTIPIVLSITLLSSLTVSFLITPMLANLVLSNKKHEASLKDIIIDQAKEAYGKILNIILHSSSLKFLIVTFTTIAFFASLSLPVLGVLKTQMFPASDVPYMYINFEAKLGTDLETTHLYAKDIETQLNKYDSIENYVLNLGRKIDLQNNLTEVPIQSNTGYFTINLLEDLSQRDKSYTIASAIRKDLKELDSLLTITVEEMTSGPPTAAPFEAKIIGADIDTLEEISNELKSKIQTIEGFINSTTDFDNNSEEIIINFDQNKLNYYQLTNSQVSQTLQTYSIGNKIGSITLTEEEYDLKIYLQNSDTKNINQLKNFQITSPLGNISVQNLGTVTASKALAGIPHIDEERSVRVKAYLSETALLADLLPQAETAIANIQLPDGYNISIGGEDEDVKKSFQELFSSMIVAVILILIILVMVFNSFRQTFIVLFSVPLAVIGIFPGLALVGLPLSFPAFLGTVMLTGIVVNDAIVLIDQINNKKKSLAITEAIYEGSTSRLIPVILTSITTIFGLIPITLTDEFWRGLGMSVIFGMLAATFLTLIIVPILYSYLFREKSESYESL